MGVATAPERQFVVFARGEQRETLLESWRRGLRQMTNPDTREAFTEEEIATATARGSKWYVEADGLDLLLLAGQQRALFLADQNRIDRAGTGALDTLHGPAWVDGRLPGTGGSGDATCNAAVGTTYVGSTLIGDPAATYATSPAGLRFQVLFTVVTPANGIAGSDVDHPLVLVGIDTGGQTNIPTNTRLTWANPPLGNVGDATTTTDFTGGTEDESDRDFARRIVAAIRHKQAAGNRAHVRGWARDASNAVEDACVYACAHHAGSVHVAVLQKRSNVQGPTARIPSAGTLAAVTAYIVAPGSAVMPTPPHVVVTGVTGTATDMTLSLSMPKGRTSGWQDLQPWPAQAAGVGTTITVVTDQTHVRITCPSALPSGVTAPSMMVWAPLLSRFEELHVTSVTSAGGTLYDVVLSSAPTKTLLVGDVISPLTKRLVLIAETLESYIDGLGPGELVDPATDLRAHRAYRFPEPSEELPQRAGAGVLSALQDALGGSLADSTQDAISLTLPALPAEVIDGPKLIVLGDVGIYSF